MLVASSPISLFCFLYLGQSGSPFYQACSCLLTLEKPSAWDILFRHHCLPFLNPYSSIQMSSFGYTCPHHCQQHPFYNFFITYHNHWLLNLPIFKLVILSLSIGISMKGRTLCVSFFITSPSAWACVWHPISICWLYSCMLGTETSGHLVIIELLTVSNWMFPIDSLRQSLLF